MTRHDFLTIKHKLNSYYANSSNFLMEKHLNLVNIELEDCIDLLEKKKLKLIPRLDELKVERENMSPYLDQILNLYDDMIHELELIAFSKS